jgi:signal transduction histidine kinase
MLQSKKQLLDLANHLELTREQERKNMAREIHDEIGHALTSLKLDINLLLKKKYLREEKLESRLGDMQKHIEETIRMLQRISAQLRPSILDHFGLIAALEWQAKEFQRQTSIRCKYEMPDEDVEINEHKTVAVFRIFQEILTNITRHSNASRVDVFLTIENNILELKVSDNGIGIRKEDLESSKSLGLIGMKERANLVEGKLTINSILNIGTTVHLTVAIN